MKRVLTKTTYLEMLAPPATVLPQPTGTRIQRLHAPSVEAYRLLYNRVGQAFEWTDRNFMPDDDLHRIICDEAVEIDVLYFGDEPAGYVELDRRIEGQIELAYFGLFPEFIGQGLGKYFLSWALARAWSFQPRRVWVHTCDLDHEAALPNYLHAGFTVYNETVVEQIVSDL
jgi:GNAT superfamily N-acetyltransferase